MTFIQPNKHSNLFTVVIVLLAVAVCGSTFMMVALYNATVNTTHNIASAKADLATVGTTNTNLNNKILGMLGGDALTNTVSADHLVLDKTPHYFSLNQSWALASHF